VKGFPSIADQAAAMLRLWPSFRMHRIDDRSATWSGPMRPLMARYEIEVLYRVPLIVERFALLRQQPRVRVVSPELRRRNGDPEGKLPHVYWDARDNPSLCLFDFETSQWTPFDLIAETTLRWSVDWLVCYEGWRATGEWTGGGRHLQLARAGN
jgi:hypothetical protein